MNTKAQASINNQHEIWPNKLAWLLAIISASIIGIQCASPVGSTDLWWHMALGRHILNTGSIITDHSIFTWTDATPYHFYNVWIAEVILYLVYAIAGSIGIIIFGFIAHASFFALATAFALQRGVITHPLAWLIITLSIVLSFTATVVQPAQFSFMFMVIIVWLYFFIRTTGLQVWWLCYLFPIILILWLNSHGEFALSSLFFMSIGLGELLNSKFSPNQAMPRQLQIHLLLALLLCIPALLINPFGYQLPLHIIYTSIIDTQELAMFTRTVTGFDPTFLYNSPPYYAIDYLIAAMLIYVFLVWQTLKNRRIDWVSIMAFLAYSFLFTKFVRATHFLAPIFVFTSLDLLANKTSSWAWPHRIASKLAIAVFCIILIGIIGWRTVNGAICYPMFGSLWASSTVKATLPVEEVDYIGHMSAVHKIGHIYQDGGYIMYRLWPQASAMIDPRYFPFKSWFNDYMAFHDGNAIPAFINKHQADVWLIPHDSEMHITWFINSKAWIPLFMGPVGIVFAPATTKNAQPQISPNIGYTDCFTALNKVFHTAVLLRNWDVAKKIQEHTAEITANRPFCQTYKVLSSEMSNTLIGIQAFIAGDYATAADKLSQNSNLIDTNGTAVAAFTLLAQQAWNGNNYAAARAQAIAALRLQPKNTASVYNAAIADWQYRQSIAPAQLKVDDDITWSFLVEILLSHKEKIPPAQALIISIFTAMKNGTLGEKPPFILQ